MTGYEVYRKAAALVGVDITSENTQNSGVIRRASDVINQICYDLRMRGIDDLSDGIRDCSEKQLDALCYGTAMLLSLSEGNAKNSVFTDIYNAKRSAALAGRSVLKDVIPKDDGGVDMQ